METYGFNFINVEKILLRNLAEKASKYSPLPDAAQEVQNTFMVMQLLYIYPAFFNHHLSPFNETRFFWLSLLLMSAIESYFHLLVMTLVDFSS